MPEIPDGATVPRDRQKKAPAKAKKKAAKAAAVTARADATGGVVDFEHNGVTYTIESDIFEDVEFLEAYADMQVDAAKMPILVRSLLGPRQWEAFKTANRNTRGRVPVDALNGLFEAADEALGNQAASSGS